ncbi:MAG: type VI secretion system membrane subunit TssM [Betaproteobacteria bacterium]|nr:type VI secretion system membrane subunit TssM [Betaproteobacteria bacterium]
MKKFFAWLVHPVFLTLLALAVFGLLVWWIGPLVKVGELEPLVSEWARALVIGVVVLLVLIRWLLRRWRANRASQRLADGLVKSSPASPGNAASGTPEQKALSDRFAEAVATLRKMHLTQAGRKPGWRDWLSLSSGSYLYELPWYLFIGAPGAGKTTALVNSGLNFPLAEKFGSGAIRGIGGTRNCDWWFTDEAVLIDTAGRYTTQDSYAQEDKSEWEGFLGLLKKARSRRPLNGIFLTVSVADLLGQNTEQRTTLAAAMRMRLLELDEKLATRLPVYVLITKADLLHGFTDYFADLGKEQRAQVFGFTLSAAESEHIAGQKLTAAFQREFALLRQRLNDGLIERMQQETDGTRRSAIFGFPAQFGVLEPILGELLDQVFTGSRFVQPPWVRGVYFTSGTQEGSPIDRVMGSLARSFGLERALLPQQQGNAHSYFLSTLLREVVFSEARLAGSDLRLERRRHVLRVASVAAMALFSAGLIAAWCLSLIHNVDYLTSVEARIGTARQTLDALPAQSGSIVFVASQLQELGHLWRTPENHEGAPPLSMTLGLYQGGKLQAAAALVHQRALAEVFLPKLDQRLEMQLRTASKTDLEFSYEALKSYLMLHQSQHFDAKALKAWITFDWERSLDRSISQEQRATLEDQLDMLLAQGAPQAVLPMDENLVRSVRALLSSYPLEARIFNRLQRERTGSDLPEFSIVKAAGPSAPLVFERTSGKPLTEGIPGLFTVNGYRKRFLAAAVRLSNVMALEEPWVLGLDRSLAGRMQDIATLDALTDRVRRLYLNEYVKRWDALLADVRLVPIENLARSIEIARILSDVDSPLGNFLRAVVKETSLIPPEDEETVVDKAADMVSHTRKELENLFGGNAPARVAPGRPVEAIVDDHFALLRRFVQGAGPGQTTPLDEALKLFNEVYVFLIAVDTAAGARGEPPPGNVAGRLKSDAGRLPKPVRGMIETLSQSGMKQAHIIEREGLSHDLHPVTDFCRRAINGRYPLVSTSPHEVQPEDFGQFFAPGGLMDDFFQKRLAALVDTSARPWRYKPAADGQMPTSNKALAQFERAARIRDIFFRGGGRVPSIRFDFKPMEMDSSIIQFILDIDGQIVRYSHGRVMSMAAQWPGPKGSNQVQMQITPPSPSGNSSIAVDGPWALLRLFDKGQFKASGLPERFFITFTIDNRNTSLEVTANSVQHPVQLRELREFSCPEGL